MGILDEAIREHLELKRQHGVGDSELKELEDEAFGPPERPGTEAPAEDALAEAPTEFMAAPELAEEAPQRREPTSSIGDLQEAPAPPEPAEEEQPAAEHETVAEPEPEPESADEEERQTIAEQPTEHFDVEEELAASAKRGPSDEELIEEEMTEPRLAPVDPLADTELEQASEADANEAEEDEDDFFDERRLSEELDQALEAPLNESDSQTADREPLEDAEEAEEENRPEPARDSDVLENTPDFLEDTPEDDELWFEQKPPKDFDFDD